LCSAADCIAKRWVDLRHEAAEGRDMKIACPICDASYEVPESVLAARRPLRCARCGHDWIPGGDEPQPEPTTDVQRETRSAPETVPEPEDEYDNYAAAEAPETITEADLALAAELADETVGEPAAPALPPAAPFVPPQPVAPRPTLSITTLPPPRAQPRRAWAVSFVALAVLAGVLLVFHKPIAHAWPPIARLYGLVGM
jgi:predicted Zn finger-like uncharacterized protein